MRPSTWTALIVVLAISLGTSARAEEAARAACPYVTAHEAALDATEAEVAKEEGFRQLRVEFNGIQGDRVPASLYVPSKGSAPYPTVLLQYGSGGHKGVDYIVRLGRQFAGRGLKRRTPSDRRKARRRRNPTSGLKLSSTNKRSAVMPRRSAFHSARAL